MIRASYARWRLVDLLVAFSALPGAAVLGGGCTSSSGGGGLAPPDPGGVFGAEVSVQILGAGRVSSAPQLLDCPSQCFKTFIFDEASPTKELALTAYPTPDWRFVGWSFNDATSATRSRGPEECQPIVRPTTRSSGADTANPTLKLAGGKINGTAPPGKEAFCGGGSAEVPLAYNVTARFVYSPQPEAGVVPDAGTDSGTDGGVMDVPIHPPPVTGATGGRIFLANGQLVWQWNVPGSNESGISSGSTSGGSRTDLVPRSTAITGFHAGSTVLFQRSTGTLASVPPFGGSTVTLQGAPTTCTGLASDSSFAYCRSSSAGTITRFAYSGQDAGDVGSVIATGLPPGPDLAVDSSYLFFSVPGTSRLQYMPRNGYDGGTGAFFDVVPGGQQNPTGVTLASSYVYWLTSDIANGSVSRAFTPSGSPTILGSKPNVQHFAVSGSNVYFASAPTNNPGDTSLWRVSTSSGSTPVLVRGGLTGVGGVAADSSNVYWTDATGGVFRASRF